MITKGVLNFIIFNWMVLLFGLSSSDAGNDRYPSAEARLVRHLLSRYGSGEPRMVRPVVNSSQPIIVQFTLSLVQILDINEKEQLLSAIYWLHLVRIRVMY